MKTILTALLIILGITACLAPAKRHLPEPAMAETKTNHVKGAPYAAFRELEDK